MITEQKRRRNKEYKERWSHPGIKGFLFVHRNRPKEAEAAAMMAERPKDTRTPAQVLMGDPLPGRSALDRRHELTKPCPEISCAMPETDGLK